MDPQWRTERLPELVRALASRPRHEALRGHMTELLRSGFDASHDEIAHEVYLLDGSGRMDTLWGATVIVQEVLVAARHRGDREQRTADQATLYWTAAAGANAGVAADATGAG